MCQCVSDEDSADRARVVLAGAFPAAGTYVVSSDSGRALEVKLSHPPIDAADPLTVLKAIFPHPGQYEIRQPGPDRGLLKAIKIEPGKFEQWFLERLLNEARGPFDSVRALIEKTVTEYLRENGGNLTSPDSLVRFEDLLFDLRQGIRQSVASPVSTAVRARLRELGFTERDVLDFAGVAYRLGLIDQTLASGVKFTWPEALRLAAATPLLRSDEVAIATARERAGSYLTPTLLRDGQAAHKLALERERDLLRTLTVDAVKREMHPREFARELYHKVGQPEGLQRDWERVARTEIMEARLRGAFEAARRVERWTPETLVYKTLGVNPCNACLMLWRNADGTPTLLTVKQLEAEDALGPNTGPWREWHHRIGVTHPNCRDSPALTYRPALDTFFAREAPKWARLRKERRL